MRACRRLRRRPRLRALLRSVHEGLRQVVCRRALPRLWVEEPDRQGLIRFVGAPRAAPPQLHSDPRLALNVLQVRAVRAAQLLEERVIGRHVEVDLQHRGLWLGGARRLRQRHRLRLLRCELRLRGRRRSLCELRGGLRLRLRPCLRLLLLLLSMLLRLLRSAGRLLVGMMLGVL